MVEHQRFVGWRVGQLPGAESVPATSYQDGPSYQEGAMRTGEAARHHRVLQLFERNVLAADQGE